MSRSSYSYGGGGGEDDDDEDGDAVMVNGGGDARFEDDEAEVDKDNNNNDDDGEELFFPPCSPIPFRRRGDNNEEGEEGIDQEEEDDDVVDFDGSWLEKMYFERDCSNNISKSLRVVPLEDVQVFFINQTWHVFINQTWHASLSFVHFLQVVSGRDGYSYFFTSMAEGPMLSSMAMQQILVLLHVIHSFIPEECILETDVLKPSFDKAGGLEKLLETLPISEEEWQHIKNRKRQIARMPLSDIPRQDFSHNQPATLLV